MTLLGKLLQAQERHQEVYQLKTMATEHNFALESAGGGEVINKKVAFVVDVSGSMAGGKLRSAKENINSIFQNHIADTDES